MVYLERVHPRMKRKEREEERERDLRKLTYAYARPPFGWRLRKDTQLALTRFMNNGTERSPISSPREKGEDEIFARGTGLTLAVLVL